MTHETVVTPASGHTDTPVMEKPAVDRIPQQESAWFNTTVEIREWLSRLQRQATHYAQATAYEMAAD